MKKTAHPDPDVVHPGLRPDPGQAGRTLAEVLHQELELAIIKGQLKPGDRLDEQEIADRYGVSRTPVREAFRMLSANELVDMRSRQGVLVRKVSVQTLLEMFQVMAELEGLCARLAARRLIKRQEADLVDIHHRLKEASKGSDIELFYDINNEFHEVIYDAARNVYLADQTRQLRNRIAPFRRRVTFMPRRFQTTLVEHEEIMRAIVRHDDEKAHAAMRNHVNLLGDDLADFIASFE